MHHAVAEDIHQCGHNLSGSVDGRRIGEGPLQGIAFGSVTTTDGAPSGPGIEGRGAVTGRH